MAETENNIESQINKSDYKILIVDDVPSNVLLLKILLQNEKFQVCTANNGHQCIEVAKQDHPDLILLDVMMPDISGFDTAVILKSDATTADIPIIFLTALNSPSDLVRGFQVGANDLLTKPFNKEELVIRVMHQISLVAAKRIIVQQNEELKSTINGRDKMYSVIAHDLRSPMTSVKEVLNMLTQLIQPEQIGAEFYKLLEDANRETDEVFHLLDNLLKWTKSQTGRLHVVYQDFDLNDVIPPLIDVFRMVAQMKKITLKVEDPGIALIVHADNDMVKTIVRNFISNAIKFSEEGSSIEIVMTKEMPNARISVVDHGKGMNEEQVAKVRRGISFSSYGTANEEGSGLGLMLCRDFAEKIGGHIELESKEGEGSTFSVLVPLA